MDLNFRVKMNNNLFVRNPEETVLGKKIVKQGLLLINELGFEDFTFKKLALAIITTESSVYRYFENKHKFLIYLITWYWSFLEYQVVFKTNNITNPSIKLKVIINLLVQEPPETTLNSDFISYKNAYKLIMNEGSKAYLTHSVIENNKQKLFKPYKDLCELISKIINECNPNYSFSHSLATTLIESSHSQKFFMKNLPSLTDFNANEDKKIILFLENLVFNAITVPTEKQ